MRLQRSFDWMLSLLLVGGLLLTACGPRARRGARPTATLAPAATSAPATHAPTLTLATPTLPPPTLAPTLPPPTVALATHVPERVALEFTTGRNDYVVEVDKTPREMLVYVPAGYDPNTPTPVVFMFHGSNQGGPLMYANTGWAAKAEQENLIVVYPTSWKYFLVTENRVSEKWNTVGLQEIVRPGAELKDDVKFVRVMVEYLTATFNVDTGRLYATGFSNGGGFVLSRLLPEMHATFAAFATSGAGLGSGESGELPEDSIDASLYSVMGSDDEKIGEGTGHALPFPVLAPDIAADPVLKVLLGATLQVLALDPAYEEAYERPSFTTMTFATSLTGAGNEFIFRMVNNMGHVYPSGDNNRAGLNVADLFWDFFVRHART